MFSTRQSSTPDSLSLKFVRVTIVLSVFGDSLSLCLPHSVTFVGPVLGVGLIRSPSSGDSGLDPFSPSHHCWYLPSGVKDNWTHLLISTLAQTSHLHPDLSVQLPTSPILLLLLFCGHSSQWSGVTPAWHSKSLLLGLSDHRGCWGPNPGEFHPTTLLAVLAPAPRMVSFAYISFYEVFQIKNITHISDTN